MGEADAGQDTTLAGAARRLRLDLAFDGTGLCGWQSQRGDVTLQDILDDALTAIGHRGPRIVGCSRTDAGVHARAFTAHVDTDLDRPPEALLNGLNAHLPRAIRVYRVGTTDSSFHARYSCTGKEYRYHLYRNAVVPPFLSQWVLRWKGKLDTGIMERASRAFPGEHDFSLFTTAYGRTRNTVRTVSECRIEEKGPLLVLHVSGVSFLHRMVRLIGGALVAVGTGRLAPERIPAMLRGVEPGLQIPALPARGLVLWNVEYPPEAEPAGAAGRSPSEGGFPL